MCPYGKLEDTSRAFDDFGANGNLIWLSVAVCFTMAMFNGFGVTVTKNASSAQRATIDTARTLLIWIFFMAVEVNGKREQFYVLQLVGFIFLVIGTLVFNEILIVPYFGFNLYTKEALAAEKSIVEKSALLDRPPETYSGVAPIAMNKDQVKQAHHDAGVSYASVHPFVKDTTTNSSVIGQ